MKSALTPTSTQPETGSLMTRERSARLDPDDLDEPAPVALAVELEEQHALPLSEAELAVADVDRLAGGAEQHRHAVRVAVADLLVLPTHVLRAPAPVPVG